MKKNKILLLCSLLLLFLLVDIKINAEAKDSIKTEFIGEIKPLKTYVTGDYAMSNDFTIEGKLVSDGKTYKNSIIHAVGGGVVYENGDEISLYIYSLTDFSIGARVSVPVEVKPKEVIEFDSKLISNIEGTIFTFDTMYRDVNGKRIYYSQDLGLEMRNSLGEIIQGTTKFSENWNYARMGVDEITYKFTPYNDSYDVYEGSFTRISRVKPKITTTKNGIRIGLANSKNRYIFRINGKDYTKQNIFNLKSKTEYKIEIIQNNPTYYNSNNETRLMSMKTSETEVKPMVLFTTTVTTK